MVTLGSKSHEILLLRNNSMPKVDERIYTTFYEKLLYWTYDDLERAQETARIINQEIREDNEPVPDLRFVLNFDELSFLNSNELALK
ncbi:1497_t:CDS:1, partial [Gigaspora rosea]